MLFAGAGEVNLTQFQLPRSSEAQGPAAGRSLVREADDECCERGCGHRGSRGTGTPAEKVLNWDTVSRLSTCSLFLHPGCHSPRVRIVGRDSHLRREPRHRGWAWGSASLVLPPIRSISFDDSRFPGCLAPGWSLTAPPRPTWSAHLASLGAGIPTGSFPDPRKGTSGKLLNSVSETWPFTKVLHSLPLTGFRRRQMLP